MRHGVDPVHGPWTDAEDADGSRIYWRGSLLSALHSAHALALATRVGCDPSSLERQCAACGQIERLRALGFLP